jgi:hypothetical protein
MDQDGGFPELSDFLDEFVEGVFGGGIGCNSGLYFFLF